MTAPSSLTHALRQKIEKWRKKALDQLAAAQVAINGDKLKLASTLSTAAQTNSDRADELDALLRQTLARSIADDARLCRDVLAIHKAAQSAGTEPAPTDKMYHKKPVVIEAMQFDGTHASAQSIVDWVNECTGYSANPSKSLMIEPPILFYYGEMKIRTLEGDMTGSKGDWIIRGVKGEFYPCKPDIFAATYEPVAAPPTTERER